MEIAMKYYKILNEKENHRGLQYYDGLNIDILPFDPSGSCEPGGIYFSRKDILAFIDYGPWIREVTLPPDAQVYKDHDDIEKWKADKVILGKRRRINAEVIQSLLNEGCNAKVEDSFALQWAAYNGHTEIVKLLIPHSDVKSLNSSALRWAARHGHTEIVKLLIPLSNVKDCDSEALRWASENGHTEIVKLLKNAMSNNS